MFQFRRFPTYDYFIHRMLYRLLCIGCPIRKSMDIAPAYGFPWLIAVNHVLHRLPVPRHPPCALCSLTFEYNADSALTFELCFLFWEMFIEFSLIWKYCSYPIFFNSCLFKTVGISCPIFSLVCLAYFLCSVFKVRYRILNPDFSTQFFKCWNLYLISYLIGGLKRTRTSDLTLIRRAL